MFDYSARLSADILPFAIELGRSVVNRQAKNGAFGFIATWVGLGALLRLYPEERYFFGNLSLYQTFDPQGA